MSHTRFIQETYITTTKSVTTTIGNNIEIVGSDKIYSYIVRKTTKTYCTFISSVYGANEETHHLQ